MEPESSGTAFNSKDRKLIRQAASSFVLIVVLAVIAGGLYLYTNRNNPQQITQVLGTEIESTPTPQPTSTPEPTVTATPKPTKKPTVKPTAKVTPAKSVTPTASSSATPTP